MKKKLLAVTVAAVLLVSCLSVAALSSGLTAKKSQSAYETVMERDGFIYGAVIPWFSTGSSGGTFGAMEALGLPCKFNRSLIEKTFYNCRSVGFQAISVWLMRGMQGVRVDESGNVLGLDEYFLKNVEETLKIAREQDVKLLVTLNPHVSTNLINYDKRIYDRYMQWLFVPEKQQAYFDKVLDPTLKLLSRYQDTVLAVQVYAEPEGDVYEADGANSSWGTTWETLAGYIQKAAQHSKKVMPDVPVTAGSGWLGFKPLKTGKYNNLGLDIIGADVYNNHGDLPAIKELKVTKPVWLTEYGCSSLDNYSDDFQLYYGLNFIDNAKTLGYKGAFYYFNGSEDQSAQGFKKYDGTVRPLASAVHFRILDNTYERSGEEEPLDKPSFYICGDDINWFACREAETYKLERSTDKKNWTVLAKDLDGVELDKSGNYLCVYSDTTAAEGQSYYYRVTAYAEDGRSVQSDPSCAVARPKSTCTPEENLLKNNDFETGDARDYMVTGEVIKVVEGTPGDTVHAGRYALNLPGSGTWEYVRQKVTCKKNTNYTLTVFAKATGAERNVSVFKMMDQSFKDPLTTTVFTLDGEWHRYTLTFNSRENTSLYLYFGDGTSQVYIDDLYLFEAEEE